MQLAEIKILFLVYFFSTILGYIDYIFNVADLIFWIIFVTFLDDNERGILILLRCQLPTYLYKKINVFIYADKRLNMELHLTALIFCANTTNIFKK